ncbi:MAG: DUF4062 domain-containing protein, partial [Planctomycetaceae bacterium]
MSQVRSFRVFISAVSHELKSCRQELARVLRKKGLEVRDQEHFRQGGATLIEQLRAYIQQCDAVICLVGDQYGSSVTAEHATVLGTSEWWDRCQGATGFSEASYTQWEFLLAKDARRSTWTFFTAAGFQPDNPSRDTPLQQQSQAVFRQWIQQTGEHWSHLTTKEQLIEDVLVLDFPNLTAPRP